jgi:hypothetical protein
MRVCLDARRVLSPDLVLELQDATPRSRWIGLTRPGTVGRVLNSSADVIPEELRRRVRHYLDATGWSDVTIRLWIPGGAYQRRCAETRAAAVALVSRGHSHSIVATALGVRRQQVAAWAASIHGRDIAPLVWRPDYSNDVMPRGLASLLLDRGLSLVVTVEEGLGTLRRVLGVSEPEARRLALLRGLEITTVEDSDDAY